MVAGELCFSQSCRALARELPPVTQRPEGQPSTDESGRDEVDQQVRGEHALIVADGVDEPLGAQRGEDETRHRDADRGHDDPDAVGRGFVEDEDGTREGERHRQYVEGESRAHVARRTRHEREDAHEARGEDDGACDDRAARAGDELPVGD